MRYRPEHKRQTRSKIVGEAARAFRAAGLNGAGVAEVMGAAGLTTGGFYAHFANKDELAAAAVQAAFEESLARLAMLDGMAPAQARETMRRFYLSERHLVAPEAGCPLPSLAADVARGPATVRAAFGQGFEALIARMARFMPGETSEQRRAAAIAQIAAMAGGILLARALDDPGAADEVLAACLAALGEGEDA